MNSNNEQIRNVALVAAKIMDEALKGNQHKIDANKNGKVDAEDFKILRGEKKMKEEVDKDTYGAQNVYDNEHMKAKKGGASDSEAHEQASKEMKKKYPEHTASRGEGQVYKLSKQESVELEEGRMKDIYTDMQDHATKKGYKNKNQFTKADYETIGKQNGVSGADVAIVARHHTADSYSKLNEAIVNHEDIAKHLIKKHGKDVSMDHIEDAIDGMDDAHKVDKQEVLYHVKKLTKEGVYEEVKDKKDLPFTPDKPHGPIAKAGKHGYGPSAAKHLAHLGMDSIKKKSLQKNSFDPLEEGTGGPIYTKPIVKLSDIMTRLKDARNLKKAKLVNNIGETPEEEVKESLMGKAGCTSEEDKKKAEFPPKVDYSKYDKPTFLRKKDDWRKSNPAHQPKTTKEEVVVEGSEDHFTLIPSDVKKKMRAHIEKGDHDAAAREAHKAGHLLKYHSLVRNAAHSFHQDYDTRHHDITDLHPYMSDYLKEETSPLPNEISARDYARREKAAKNNKIRRRTQGFIKLCRKCCQNYWQNTTLT